MNEWREDYEDDDGYGDDFEDELSVHSQMLTTSVPATQVSNTSGRTPSTTAAPVRDQAIGMTPVNNQQLSLETSFESYDSSGEGQIFASSRRELSTPSSSSASRHSDPMYPTEEPQRPALQSREEQIYRTEIPTAAHVATAVPSPHDDVAIPRLTSSKAVTPHPSSSSHPADTPQNTGLTPHAHRYVTEASAVAGAAVFESYETPEANSPDRAPPIHSSRHRRDDAADQYGVPDAHNGPTVIATNIAAPPYLHSASTSTSSSSVNHSDDNEDDHAQVPLPAQPRHQQPASSTHLNVSHDPTSLAPTGKQSGSDMPGSIRGTVNAAMVAAPKTRDVSGLRRNPSDDGIGNNYKKKAIHQSNYITVKELDDEPLPQYKGRPPTVDHAELSDIEDEADKNEVSRFYPQERIKQEVVAAPSPRLSPAPAAIPSRSSSSSSSSRVYSDTFTGTILRQSSSRPSSHPTPTPLPSPAAVPSTTASNAHKSSPSSKQTTASGRSNSEIDSSAAKSKITPRATQRPSTNRDTSMPLSVSPLRQSTPTLDMSIASDMKNHTAPYSGPGLHQVLREDTAASRTASSSSTSSSASSGVSERGAGEERAKLLLRIADLQVDIATWNRRIESKRAQFAAAKAKATAADNPTAKPLTSAKSPASRAGRGSGPHPYTQRSNSKALPVIAHRKVSGGRGRSSEAAAGAANGANSGENGRPITKVRLEALRKENAKLETAYVRLGGEDAVAASIDVPALVARADKQLQKARARLKEVTAARRALENRDKRAAHTIEEVHKRMPSSTELQERQLNEGIYSRTGLQRTVQELKANIDRTRAATMLMETRCTELTAQVQERHLSSITPKEYEALRSTLNTKKKVAEKLKVAIAVYSAAVAQDAKGGGGPDSGGNNLVPTPTAGATRLRGNSASGRLSGGTSHSTSPRKSSKAGRETSLQSNLTSAEQQAMEDHEAGKAALLEDQHAMLSTRKQELQKNIDDLWRRIQQRNEQIKANKTGVAGELAGNIPDYITGGSDDEDGYNAGNAVGSGAAATRKASLRNVLRAPVGGKRTKKDSGGGGGASLSPSPVRESPVAASVAAAPSSSSVSPPNAGQDIIEGRSNGQNSAAAERLRGAVAAARQKRSRSNQENPAAAAPPHAQHDETSEELSVKEEPQPFPPPTVTEQRTVREAHPTVSSAFTTLADAPQRSNALSVAGAANGRVSPSAEPVEEEEDVDNTHGTQYYRPTAAPNTTATTSGEDEQMRLEDDDGIDAVLHKIDEDNKRIGEVFGRALQSSPHDDDNGCVDYAHVNARPSGEAAHCTNDVDEEEEVDEILEEEVPEAGEGSGRSTPEWLREI